MKKRIFVWIAHPNSGSLNEALAEAYMEGARSRGAEVREMRLSEMDFDMGALKKYGGEDKPVLEPALLEFQENLQWSDHFVILHPIWWGAMPAQAKAVLDRALLPGFAFKYRDGMAWDKLLAGRTADVLLTSDAPPWLDTLLYLASWRRVLKSQILGFCGLKVRKMVQLGSVKLAKPEKIRKWLDMATKMGRKAASERVVSPRSVASAA